jgi:hypothetical protein
MAALNLFDKLTRHIDTEPIDQLESQFIDGASMGALIFARDYEGPAHKFDIKSFYPSMYNSSQKFPVKKGEFKYICTKELEEMEFAQFGIYRCVITPSRPTKLFRINPRNYYTHIDIKHARELGFKIEMIEDGQSNHLYYAPDKLVLGSVLFGEFINTIFPLKQQGVKGAKQVLNFLWGALSERKLRKQVVNENAVFEIEPNVKITCLKSSLFNDDIIMKTHSNEKMFKFAYARMMPHLLSKGRMLMSQTMRPFESEVIRCHTDGFTVSRYPKDIKISQDLGGLCYEGYCEEYTVKSCNDFDGEFK